MLEYFIGQPLTRRNRRKLEREANRLVRKWYHHLARTYVAQVKPTKLPRRLKKRWKKLGIIALTFSQNPTPEYIKGFAFDAAKIS